MTRLHAVEPKTTVNAIYYRERILPIYLDALEDPTLFPSQTRRTFMQDGAPAHNTRENMPILEEEVLRVWAKGV